MKSLTTLLSLAALIFLSTGCCEPLIPKKTLPPEPELPVLPEANEVPLEAAPIPFIVIPSDSSNTVSFKFVFNTGSAEDPVGKKGIGLLTASLMAMGGTEDLSYSELVERLFPMAAEIDFDMDREQTTFFGRVHKDHLEDYYKIFADVLLAPRLSEEDFSRVKDQQKTALTLTLRGNDDEELGKAALAHAMYATHPYGDPVLGIEADLESITLDDVKAHRASVMCGSRLTVGLGGNVSDSFVEKVREDMKRLPSNCSEISSLEDSPRPEGRKVLLVDKPTAESTAISIGFPIDVTRGQADYAALKLVEAYFGQHRTFSGKLQIAIRVKRGFNYGNYAYSEYFEQEGWARIPKTNMSRRGQYFSLWLRPSKDADKHFVLRMALNELDKMIRDGITEEELEKTRTFVKRYYRTFAQTELRNLGYAIDDHFYGQSEPYFDKLFADISALTADDVNAAIKKHLTADNLHIAMVTKNAEKFADDLASDAPCEVTYAAEKPADILEEDTVIKTLKLGIERDDISIIKVDDIFK